MSATGGFVPITGNVVDMEYWYEDTFAGGGTVKRRFGHAQRIDRISISREYERIYKLGSRQYVANIPMRWGIDFSVAGILSDPYILEFFLKPNVDTSSTPATLNGYVFDNEWIRSGVVDLWVKGASAIEKVEIAGFVPRTLSLNIRNGETVEFTLDGVAAKISKTTDTALPSVTVDSSSGLGDTSDVIHTYWGASIGFGSDSSLSEGSNIIVSSMTMRINQNPNMVFVVGSDVAKTVFLRQFVVTGSVTAYITDLKTLDKILNNENIAEIDVTLTGIGLDGSTSSKTITIKLTDIVKIENLSYTIQPNNAVTVSFDYAASNISVTTSGYLYY